jgi:hypothetical protein
MKFLRHAQQKCKFFELNSFAHWRETLKQKIPGKKIHPKKWRPKDIEEKRKKGYRRNRQSRASRQLFYFIFSCNEFVRKPSQGLCKSFLPLYTMFSTFFIVVMKGCKNQNSPKAEKNRHELPAFLRLSYPVKPVQNFCEIAFFGEKNSEKKMIRRDFSNAARTINFSTAFITYINVCRYVCTLCICVCIYI